MNIDLKLSIVTPWYGYFAGGAEVAARSFAEALRVRGFDVEVLTTCSRSPFESWWEDALTPGIEELNGVCIRRFRVNKAGESTYHSVVRHMLDGGTPSEEHQRAFTAFSLNSDELLEYGISQRDRIFLGLPYIQGLIYQLVREVGSRTYLIPCLHDEPQAGWKTSEEMFCRSMGCFFLSEEEKSLAIQLHGLVVGRRLVESPVIGVGFETELSADRMADAEGLLGVLPSIPEDYFTYVGRKDKGKNILRLIDFFRQYRASGGEASLVFLGGGDDDLVPFEPGFIDLGFVDEGTKRALISGSQGVINLSEMESFSIVLMEAWLFGVPVIVSANCPVTAGHCRRSNGGFAVSNSRDFVQACRTLESGEVASRLAWAGALYTRENYSWNRVLSKLIRRIVSDLR